MYTLVEPAFIQQVLRCGARIAPWPSKSKKKKRGKKPNKKENKTKQNKIKWRWSLSASKIWRQNFVLANVLITCPRFLLDVWHVEDHNIEHSQRMPMAAHCNVPVLLSVLRVAMLSFKFFHSPV